MSDIVNYNNLPELDNPIKYSGEKVEFGEGKTIYVGVSAGGLRNIIIGKPLDGARRSRLSFVLSEEATIVLALMLINSI